MRLALTLLALALAAAPAWAQNIGGGLNVPGGGTPGGSNTQVQYKNGTALGGITGATTDGTTLTLVAPILGTPASGTLTNATGLPVAGISGLGTGVATALGTASSGSGGPCLITSCVMVTPALGTPASGTLTNATGLPIIAGTTGTLTVARGGTNCTAATVTCFNNITGFTAAGTTGTTSTNLVFSTSPALTTPTLGVATATSINKWAFTAPATAITLTGTDNATYTMPTATASLQATFAPAVTTGKWFLPPFLPEGVGTALNATGTAQFIPFLMVTTETISQVTGRTTTLAASGNVQFAIYANGAGKPTGTPLISTGSASTASAPTVLTPGSFSGTPTLTPGLYWFGVAADTNAGGVAVMMTLVNTQSLGASFIGSATTANIISATGATTLSLTTPLTFGTWGDLTSATFTEVNTLKSAMPIMLVQ